MQNLIYFLLQYGYLLLFILLQVVSISMMVSFNEHQKNVFLSSTHQLTSWMDDGIDRIEGYFNLAQVSKDLARENAALRQQIYAANDAELSHVETKVDSNATDTYQLIPAKVVSNVVTGLDNFISINKGYRNGIREGMGIISENGIVGVITDVSGGYAKAISVLNRSFRASAKFKEKNFFGYLEWLGGDPQRAALTDIPKHAQVDVGDIIVSSGYSTIFPSDIELGRVESVTLDDGSNFYRISVLLNEDMASIEYVYIVDNLKKSEQFDVTKPTNR
ncbi:MAG: rod shape-determining protein MreC [Saprospiraceae bacterium]|nr:rod shape-determining protein MreC [Saprospiraceae bacterium]